MKILLVTSKVTFVRDNYQHLLATLSNKAGTDIAGLLVIDNLDAGLVLKTLGIFLAGARKIAGIILKNSLTSLAGRREALFKEAFHSRAINHPDTLRKIKAMDLDLIVNLRTREIYGKELLALPRLGCLNVHHGILPDNRGTLCDLWALYEKRPAGFSIHMMNEKIDEGDILAVETLDTSDLTDYSRLPVRSSVNEAACLLAIIDRFKNNTVEKRPNISATVRLTKNPTAGEIRAMKRSGLLL